METCILRRFSRSFKQWFVEGVEPALGANPSSIGLKFDLDWTEESTAMSLNQKQCVTGVILAGGQGRRMGGHDKGWVEFQNKPFIQHVLERLRPQVDQLIINANRSQAAYQALGVPVVEDLQTGFQGPLMGIATALSAAEHEWVLCVPCDGLFIPQDLVSRLLQAALNSGRAIVVADDGDRLQPMVVLLKRSVLPNLLQALEQGERKPDRWYASQGMAQVSFSVDELYNFNYPEQLLD